MSLFPGPYHTGGECRSHRVYASNGEWFPVALDQVDIPLHEMSAANERTAAEIVALLNAGWEAKQRAEKVAASPEQRIADDLGVPVAKLVKIATEAAKEREYPFEIATAHSRWVYRSNDDGDLIQEGWPTVKAGPCHFILKSLGIGDMITYAGPLRVKPAEVAAEMSEFCKVPQRREREDDDVAM